MYTYRYINGSGIPKQKQTNKRTKFHYRLPIFTSNLRDYNRVFALSVYDLPAVLFYIDIFCL